MSAAAAAASASAGRRVRRRRDESCDPFNKPQARGGAAVTSAMASRPCQRSYQHSKTGVRRGKESERERARTTVLAGVFASLRKWRESTQHLLED